MHTIKLTEENRLELLDLYWRGKIRLTGTELDLTAIATNEPRRECLDPTKVMRLVRAQKITLLKGVEL